MNRDPITTVAWAFHQNFHADKSNACIHMSDTRFSPITFALAEILEQSAHDEGAEHKLCDHIREVTKDIGKYRPDPGRVAEQPQFIAPPIPLFDE